RDYKVTGVQTCALPIWALRGILRQFRLVLAGRDRLAAPVRRRAAEYHEVDQRVRPEPIGAVDRNAGGLAERHQARHHVVSAAVRSEERRVGKECSCWWP